eukprot:1930398-Rhodomonas_salina.2
MYKAGTAPDRTHSHTSWSRPMLCPATTSARSAGRPRRRFSIMRSNPSLCAMAPKISWEHADEKWRDAVQCARVARLASNE